MKLFKQNNQTETTPQELLEMEVNAQAYKAADLLENGMFTAYHYLVQEVKREHPDMTKYFLDQVEDFVSLYEFNQEYCNV